VCGIAGIVAVGEQSSALAHLDTARAALSHRGPDGGGTWASGDHRAGLVHTRLAIVDLAGGQQPIANEDQTIQLVFNGEIYNHVELQRDLEAAGHRFRTRCDAEVLVHLYEQHGTEMFEHLNGMFAFALWDERRQQLLIARDRLGQKPLYYSANQQQLLFASELKALRPLLNERPQLRPSAVDDFLSFKYIRHGNGLFESIHQLPPGKYLTWRQGSSRTATYWSHPQAVADFDGSFEEAAVTLRELLQDATRLRLRSDVPVGVLLSGGIDSALTVGLIAESGVRPIRTFTASFDNLGVDERPYAQAVARRFGTEHCELKIPPPNRELVYRVIQQFDEPFADTSAIPTYLISQQARQHVKVVLTGDGGDESFLGYTRYADYRRYLQQRRWMHPLLCSTGLEMLGRRLCPHPEERTFWRRFRTLTNLWQPAPHEVYERWYASLSPITKRQLYLPRFGRLLAETTDPITWMQAQLQSLSRTDPVTGAAAFDLRHYLPDAVLTKVDRASMAHGLECRSPFLDHRVVEFAAKLPAHWRLHPTHGSKWILRQACHDLLPEELHRRPKTGFGAPVGDWLRHDLARSLAEQCLPSNGLEQWLNRRYVERLLSEHRTRADDHTYRLWTLLVLNRFWSDKWWE
jgi:asparagine synthase (glutamine-hydrolysing)